MRYLAVMLVALGVVATPAVAQETLVEAVVVTGERRSHDMDDEGRPPLKAPPLPASVQMLRRYADFAVQQVVVTSDTREEDQRRNEIYAMTRNALQQAGKSGVQLATGDLIIEPLTLGNHKDLVVFDDEDSGGEAVKFLVKVPLAPDIDAKAALARIDKFLKAVQTVGRAQTKPYSDLTLSVVNPEQYRGAIIDLVAKDTATTSAKFGQGYGVEVSGLDRPVQWKRASLTEVLLYLPSTSTVRPRN